jgi:hypothetical protein
MFDQPQRALIFYELALEVTSLTSCALELENFLFGHNVVLPVYRLNVTQASCDFIGNTITPPQSDSTSASVAVEASLSRLYGQPKLRPNRKDGLWLNASLFADISNRSRENLDE